MNETDVNEKSLKRAEVLTEIKRWREAIHELHQFLRDSPQHYRALCLTAWCYFELDEQKNALDYTLRAIEANPQNEWAHRLRASIFRRQGKSREAMKAASEAVRLEPSSIFALYTLTLTQIDNRLLNQATSTANKLLEIAPESFDAHSGLGYVALECRNWAIAERHFRRALQINPQSFEAMNKVGWSLLQQTYVEFNLFKRKQKLREAAEHFRAAVQIDPTSEVARTNLIMASQNHFLGLFNHEYSLVVVVVFFVLFRFFAPFKYTDFKALAKLFTPIHDNPYILAVNIYFSVLLFLHFKSTLQKYIDTSNGIEPRKLFVQRLSTRRRFALEMIICAAPILVLSSFVPFQNQADFTKLPPFAWFASVCFLAYLMFSTARFVRIVKST